MSMDICLWHYAVGGAGLVAWNLVTCTKQMRNIFSLFLLISEVRVGTLVEDGEGKKIIMFLQVQPFTRNRFINTYGAIL